MRRTELREVFNRDNIFLTKYRDYSNQSRDHNYVQRKRHSGKENQRNEQLAICCKNLEKIKEEKFVINLQVEKVNSAMER